VQAAGKAVQAIGTPDEVKRLMRGAILEIRARRPREAASLLRARLEAQSVGLFGDRVHLVSSEPDRAAGDAAAILAQGSVEVLGVRPVEPSLEDVFVSVLAQANEEAGHAAR